MMPGRLVLAIAALLAAFAAHAERATERYAPTQIGVAREFLERARSAAGLQQYEAASRYARQAEVDARIAWGMTDAPGLRAEAATIAGAADALARRPAGAGPVADITTRNPARELAWHPLSPAPAPGAVPSPR